MIVGATVAMVALTTIAQTFMLRSSLLGPMTGFWQMWILALTSGAATILVMSILQSNLVELYGRLSQSETKALQEARKDALTGLANRKHLHENILNLLDNPNATGVQVLLFIDLNKFKVINDSLGHHYGDELLREVGNRLTNKLPASLVARLGGDEFAVICHVETEGAISGLCDELVQDISRPYRIGNSEARIGLSVGAVTLATDVSSNELMRRADIAMYLAKSTQTRYRIFDSAMLNEVMRRHDLEQNLRTVLASGQGVGVEFQPILKMASEVVAVEALVRWTDAKYGTISASEVISVAEEGGLTEAVALSVVRKCCEAAKSFPNVIISINLGSRELLSSHFSAALKTLVRSQDLKPSRFQFEIGGAVLLGQSDDVDFGLRILCEAGFSLVADNVGCGPMSLPLMRKRGISAIKLDPSLIREARTSRNIAPLRATIHFAKAIGLDVILTGVQDEEDESIAIQAGADALQGFRYFPPMRLEDCRDIIGAPKRRVA